MADPESIYDWQRLDNRITTSGQPTATYGNTQNFAAVHAVSMWRELPT
jgi:hypothetical protein